LKDNKVKAPQFTPKQMQSATFKKFHRYAKNKTYNVPEHNEDEVQSSVKAKKINNKYVENKASGTDPNSVKFEFSSPKYYTTHTQDET